MVKVRVKNLHGTVVYRYYRMIMGSIEVLLANLNGRIKKKNAILFYNTELRDNSKYLLSYASRMGEYRIICYTKRPVNKKSREDGVIYTSSLIKLIYYHLTSKVVILSFFMRLKIKPARDQTIIQLWHGSPLKKIGNDQVDYGFDQQRGRYFTYILCANDLFRETYIKAFGCLEEQIKIWGNPRNDLLFKPLEYDQVVDLVGTQYQKLILWLPTYRRSSTLHQSDSHLDIPVVNIDNIRHLDKYLEERNCVLVIKLHPHQDKLAPVFSQQRNVILLCDSLLHVKGCELYSLLGAADALITDYSSVYFDYLLVNKPIGFMIEDIDEYKEKRGFIFDEPEALMPGQKIRNLNDLEIFISNLIHDKDDMKLEREKVNCMVNYYSDGNNCKRVYDEIRVLLGDG